MRAAVVDVSITRTTLATSVVETARADGGEERSASAGDVLTRVPVIMILVGATNTADCPDSAR